MKAEDKHVLDALYPATIGWLSNAEWLGVVKAVETAGSITATAGFPRELLEKAARSFGGNRSAAGRYAAEMRWSRSAGSGTGSVESGYLSDPKRATPKPPPTWKQVLDAGGAARVMTVAESQPPSMRAKVDSAREAANRAKEHDIAGRRLEAWERSSVAAFEAEQAAAMPNAPVAVKAYAEVLGRLVLHMTDKYHSRAAA